MSALICEHCGEPVTIERPLTKTLRQTLDYLVWYIGVHDHGPSYEEIAAYFRLNSLASVHERIEKLEAAGYITKTPMLSRSITILRNAA